MRTLLTVLIICLLPVVGLGLGFLAHSPDVRAMLAPVVGLNQIDYVGFGGAGDGHLHLADTAGIHWARQGVWWYHVEGDAERFAQRDWSGYDALFSDLRDRLDENGDTASFEIMPVFAGMPAWAADSACAANYNHAQCPPAPEHMGDWRDFIEAFADRYFYIDYYEVWNEAYGEDWNVGNPTRIFMKGSPSQLIEMTDSLAVALNSEDKVIGWGNPGSAQGDGHTSRHLLDMTNAVDIVSTHCYGPGPACVSKNEQLRDSLVAHGYSDIEIWSTEGYRTSSGLWASDSVSPIQPTDSSNRQYINSFSNLAESESWFGRFFLFRWAQEDPYYHHHDTMPDNSDWHRHGWNYRIIRVDENRNLLGVRPKSYCALVVRASNEGQEDRCPDAFDITGHHFTSQEVPPNTTCNFAQSTTSGSWPYSWDWYVNGTYQGSGDSFDYTTASSGTFDVRVVVTDDNGARDEYTETMTVESGTICVE